MEYEVVIPDPSIPMKFIRRMADGAMIPCDFENRDFQEFLAWNAQQASPLAWE